MKKKLMVLVAGALAALAFAALPATSSAGEWNLDCEKLPCEGTVESTGNSVFSIVGGDTVLCTSVTGSVTAKALSGSKGTSNLTFHNCKEQNTIFHFNCQNGATTGDIATGNQETDNVYLEDSTAAKTVPGTLVTNASVTFTCAGGFASTTVTGNALGEFENLTCGVATKKLTVTFEATGHGQQKWKQVTTTGSILDLIGKTSHSNAESTYVTSSQTGTAHLNWTQNVTPTCHA
jgi:hypothetical protein